LLGSHHRKKTRGNRTDRSQGQPRKQHCKVVCIRGLSNCISTPSLAKQEEAG
jgi:hypothetical protein